VSEPFHDVGGVFHHGGQEGRLSSPDPARRLVRLIQRSGRQWLAVTETHLCVIGASSGGLMVAAGGSTSTKCALEVGRVGQK
jgi:hypothetical protein